MYSRDIFYLLQLWNQGKILKGWPVTTIVNGNVVYDNGEIFDIKAEEVQYAR